MKKLIEFIKKYWKELLALLGISVVIEQILQHNQNTIKVPDTTPLKKDIDIATDKKIQQIKDNVAITNKEIDAQTPQQVMNNLSTGAQQEIKDSNKKATDEAVNNILGQLN